LKINRQDRHHYSSLLSFLPPAREEEVLGEDGAEIPLPPPNSPKGTPLLSFPPSSASTLEMAFAASSAERIVVAFVPFPLLPFSLFPPCSGARPGREGDDEQASGLLLSLLFVIRRDSVNHFSFSLFFSFPLPSCTAMVSPREEQDTDMQLPNHASPFFPSLVAVPITGRAAASLLPFLFFPLLSRLEVKKAVPSPLMRKLSSSDGRRGGSPFLPSLFPSFRNGAK